jgi:ABC-2 type transport system permease protein
VIGGQYLLQGVAEEKESRILESMLCTVNASELLAGKLFGLGAAGLTIVGAWITMGALLGGPVLALAQVHVRPAMLALAVVFFLLGYLFYGSIMTGIGAITNNMREAQQFAFLFTFMNFIPFYLMTSIVGRPDSGVALGLSLFPPMAPVAMMLRLSAPSSAVPAWQIALSIGLLAGAAWLALFISARLFRIGLLMYGKTPTLPEILRWVRQS